MTNNSGWLARLRTLTATVAPALLAVFGLAGAGSALGAGYTCPAPDSLPLPSSKPLNEYESVLGQFLERRCYAGAGWASDKYVRNTGPHLVYLDRGEQPADWDGVSAGTHNAVWIYYSARVYQWMLEREQRTAARQLQAVNTLLQKGAEQQAAPAVLPPIPDGAMII